MKLHLHTYNLELKEVFRISHSSRTMQPSLIVELEEDGLSGFGEATATSYYGLHLDEMVKTLEEYRPTIERVPLDLPENHWDALRPILGKHPFLQCAVDVAAHDLWGKQQGKPLYDLWDLSLEQLPLSNYTIGIGTLEEMEAKIKKQPWPIYKIKLGTSEDLKIIERLRQHTEARFRVDANCAWTAEQTIAYAPRLKELGVEFIEQPMPMDAFEDMKKVYRESVLPIIADESCQKEADVARCAGHFHGINIKLMKCGGLSPAKRMIAEARALDMQVMVGCMTESSVGIAAIAQLLPLLDYVDMDGALLLKQDIASGVTLQDGKVHYPDRNGTGVELL